VNAQQLREDFEKCFGKENAKVEVVSVATPIPFFGSGLQPLSVPLMAVGITPYSMVAFRKREDDIFRMREHDSVLECTCPKGKLSQYESKDFARELFGVLGRISKSETGTDFLLYQKRISALGTHLPMAVALAAERMNAEKIIPEQVLQTVVTDEEKRCEEAVALFSGQNKVLLTDGKQVQYAPSPAEACKIVLTLTEKPQKTERLRKMVCKRYRGAGKEAISRSASEAEPGYRRWLLFAEAEQRRITEAMRCLEKKDRDGFGKIMNHSAAERLRVCGKKAHMQELLFRIAEPISLGCNLLAEHGIISIVPDAEVDRFIETVHEAYQKKAGELPAFLICDMADTK